MKKKNILRNILSAQPLMDVSELGTSIDQISPLIKKIKKRIKKIQKEANKADLLLYIKCLEILERFKKEVHQEKLEMTNLRKKQITSLVPHDDLKKFYKYASQDTQGNFYHDALDDLKTTFFGGEAEISAYNAVSPILALTQFKPISSDGFVKGKHPFKALSKRVYVLPIEQINTTLPHVPIAPNPFQPYELWGNSISSFIYKGKNPSYVQITGSLSIFVKLYNVTPEQHRYSCKAQFIAPELWCEFLLTEQKPNMERSSRRGLAMDTAPMGKAVFRIENDTISLNPHPKTYSDFYKLIEQWDKHEKMPIDMKKWTLYPKVLSNHRLNHRLGEPIITKGWCMTDWFLLPPCLCFTTNTDGTSSIIHIQYKDAYDKIWFAPLDKNITSANEQFFIIPSNARYARIAFSKFEDTAKKLQIHFFPKEVDPTYGMWTSYQLDINSFYTFYPNTPFQIVLRFYGGNFFSVDSQSFFINSGGLQCFINVKDELENTLKAEK